MLDASFNVRTFALRLLLAYMVLFLLTLSFPKLYVQAISPLLISLSSWAPGETRIRAVEPGSRTLHIEAESDLLQRFVTEEGQAGPPFHVTADLFTNAVNVYPLVVLSLLAAWPMRWRRLLLALLVALPLVMLAGVLDTWLLVQWSGAEGFAKGWPSVAGRFPMTPWNAEAGRAAQESFDQLRALKTFVSTGGRQFIAVLVAAVSVAIATQSRPRR